MSGHSEERKSAYLRDMTAGIGKRLMDAWNGKITNPSRMAVMGHLEGDDYTFVIQDAGFEWQVTVRNTAEQVTEDNLPPAEYKKERLRKILTDRLDEIMRQRGASGDPA